MTGQQLLEKHPLTAGIIKEYFITQMLLSFNDKSVPEEFKQMMKEQGIDNERVGTLIDTQPRNLFDVFDENDLYININPKLEEDKLISFHQSVNLNENFEKIYKTRKEAELFAITEAFELLENKLKIINFPKLKENA